MATLQSITTGNFTSSSTWALVNSTTFVDSSRTTAFTLTTVTTNATTAFTPGAITISGISLNMQGRTATPTGTMTVRLWNNTAGSIVKDVVVNISDLPSTYNTSGTPHIGWVYFKFDTNITLLAATAYTIRVYTSNGAQVSIYTSSLTTSANLSKALITTTNQAPAASDILLISGTYDSSVTSNIVTMNNTAATTFGLISIAANGVLNYGTSTSTNYILTLAGSFLVGAGGTFTMGTSLNPIPSTSTATLQLTCTTALQYVMLIYGTMTTYGSSKEISTKLATSTIVGATNSTTTTTTNWSSGDLIVVPSTTRTYTQYELLTLNTNSSGTTLTHGAYVNAHDGNPTLRVQADIVNLTRNVIIRSTTGTLLTNKTNIQMFGYSVTSFYYTAFLALGTGVTITNSGICVNTLTSGVGSFDFQYNVVREIATLAAANTACTALQTDNNISSSSISNNIFYSLGWTTTVVSTVITSITDNNYFIACLSTTQALNANFAGSNNVFTSNSATGASIALFYNNASNNHFYSNGSIGLSSTIGNNSAYNSNLSNFRFWRNNTYGYQISSSSNYNRNHVVSFTGVYCFGNTIASINITTRLVVKILFTNSYFYGGPSLQQPNHFVGSLVSPVDSIYYDSCYFGYTDSSLTSSYFSSAILTVPINSTYKLFSNCYFNTPEATLTTGYPYTNLYGGYRSFNHNGVTGSNKEWSSNGTITTDTTMYLSNYKSTRLTPNNKTYKLTTPIVKVPVKYNQTCTISTKIRKSLVADTGGVVYNGSDPRLVYVFNPILGNFTETICATATYSTSNQITSPQNFENWTKPQATAVIGATAAPDGTLTGTAHIPSITTGVQHSFASNYLSYTTGVTYTASVYAKKGTQNNIAVTMDFTAFGNVWRTVVFNLNTGTVVSNNTNSGIAPTITNVGNGWYRCTCTNTATTTIGNAQFTLDRQFNNYTGDNQISFYVWGAMQNIGTTALPYLDNGVWETLTYTTGTFSSDGIAEFYVDCDGTAGWINVDDWDTTTVNDSRGQDYWGTTGVYIEPTFRNPTRASGYNF